MIQEILKKTIQNHGKEQFLINVIGWKEERFEIEPFSNDDTFSSSKQLETSKRGNREHYGEVSVRILCKKTKQIISVVA